MKIGLLFVHLLFVWSIGRCQTITTIAGTGVAGYSGDGGAATLAKLTSPADVAIDKYGNIFISDLTANVIRKLNGAGSITTIAGTGNAGYTGDGGLATNAELNGPIGIVIDENDNIFIAEYENHVIRKVSSSGIITTIAGIGVSGYSGDGDAATSAKLFGPYGLEFDKNGNLFFSDALNHIIRKINPSGTISTIAGNGISGYSGDFGPATNAKLTNPGILAIHPKTGDLYISDHINRRVRKIDKDGFISTVAGNGITGNDGDGGPATLAKLYAPNAVCFDTAGNFYISDNSAHVIRKVNSIGIISTIAGTGTMGFNGDGVLATATQLKTPTGGAFDKWGNLYFADVGNSRARRINYNPILSVNVLNETFKAVIRPNPASGEVVIITDKINNKITLVNTLGQPVIQWKIQARESRLDIDHLPAGVYLVNIDDAYAGKFVKE